MRYFLLLSICFLISCSSNQLEHPLKNSAGLFQATVVLPNGENTTCSGKVTQAPNNFTVCSLTDELSHLEKFENLIFLFQKGTSCGEEIPFFPLATVEIKNETGRSYAIAGMPVSVKSNPKEITDFFNFQMNYRQEIDDLRQWIEESSSQSHFLVRWTSEQDAMNYLERLSQDY